MTIDLGSSICDIYETGRRMERATTAIPATTDYHFADLTRGADGTARVVPE